MDADVLSARGRVTGAALGSAGDGALAGRLPSRLLDGKSESAVASGAGGDSELGADGLPAAFFWINLAQRRVSRS
jgi:hypothetical protein